jgi:hypothetical protein
MTDRQSITETHAQPDSAMHMMLVNQLAIMLAIGVQMDVGSEIHKLLVHRCKVMDEFLYSRQLTCVQQPVTAAAP